MTQQHRVTFLPEAVSEWVPAGTNLLAAAAEARVAIDAPCGDRGVCGKCRVKVEPRAGPLSLSERTLISDPDAEAGWRLACQTAVTADLTVTVPERALKPAVVPIASVELRPDVRKLYVRLREATIQDPASDLSRLRESLPPEFARFRGDLAVLRQLPSVLREAGHALTATFVGQDLVSIEPGDTTSQCYGVAVDLGTTSVVVILVDLVAGKVLGVESRLNGQANFGSDVVSRIHAVIDAGNAEPLQAAAAGTINAALAALLEKNQAGADRVYQVVVVGNSCMSHLFLGVDPSSLSLAPYQPVVSEATTSSAGQLGLAVNPNARVHTLPNVAGFVGSDTVAVILATALHKSGDLKLAIDLGTNGEMVLGNRERLLACSTAAGPAFEGARISCGMRATEGAIERVWLTDWDLKVQVVGGGKPLGICGSGLLDAAAQLRAAGLLEESGKLAATEPETNGVFRRLVEVDGARGFLLGQRGRRRVVLTQQDVRELQLAKGAIRAGISILLKEFGASPDDLSEVLLAGAFGSYISPASARAVGLIPPVSLERVTAVGNAAGQGALMALLSADLREEASRIARMTEYVELSARADFMDQFMDALSLS